MDSAVTFVPLASRRVRSGEIDLHAMAVGYLAAFAAATGTTLEGELSQGSIDRKAEEQLKWLRDAKGHLRPRPEPVFPVEYPPIPVPEYREETEWPPDGEYGLPKTIRGYFWGTSQCGLNTFDLGNSIGLTFWRFTGLPEGCTLSGDNRLEVDYASHAKLTASGPADWVARVSEAFRSALARYDQRNEPDGAIAAELEIALTTRVKYSHNGEWGAIDTTPLQTVLGTTTASSSVVTAARFWLAAVAMGRNQFDAALAILEELYTLGERATFSHGINVFYMPDGSPLTVGWQDEFAPPYPHDEIWLARAVVLAKLDRRDRALMQLRTIAMAEGFTSHTQAAALVDAMTAGVDELQADWDESVAEHHRSIAIRGFFERRAPERYRAWKAAADEGDWRGLSLASDCLLLGTGTKANLRKGAKLARLAAEQGNPAAMMNWAMILSSGIGCEANPSGAERFTITLAQAGEARACANCGFECRSNGQNGEPKHPAALNWFRLGAEGGSLLAQAQYGAFLLAGWGGIVDASTAIRWLTIAATRGSASAQDNLAVAFLYGCGVEQSETKAFTWFLKAAENGVKRAQTQVAEMYAEGRGVKADPRKATRWRKKANTQK